MKRKSYFSFLLPRVITALLIAAVLFSILYGVLDRAYVSALSSGWNRRQERYEQIVRNYAENKCGDVFIDCLTNLYTSDYFRMAEVKEDGTFETVTETDYKSIPIEDNMLHWYYITNDKELLEKGKRNETINGRDWTIEYKKCDEAWGICTDSDLKVTNSWDIAAQSDVYYSNTLFTVGLDFSGGIQYHIPLIKSHYVDGDTLHIGKANLTYYNLFADLEKEGPFLIKKWDFTDPSKADRYITMDEDGFASHLLVLPQRVRPEEFFNANSEMFLANSMDELQKAYAKQTDKDASFEAIFKEFTEKKIVGGTYAYRASLQKEYADTDGGIDFFYINGKLYMFEYVITTVSFVTMFKPFLILLAVLLALAAVIIACLASIRPYSQYKKAYENNIFKNNLIDSLAHNMKTPLQILGGYAENLKDVSSDAEKDRYAEQILEKTSEMNKDIEAILKTVEKTDRKFAKESVRSCIGEVAAKLGEDVQIKGDAQIKMDKEYFKTALYCLLDNAVKYKSTDSKIEVDITCKAVTIRNKTDKDKFTPGTGISIAGRILEQHKLHLNVSLKDGVFESVIGKKPKKN